MNFPIQKEEDNEYNDKKLWRLEMLYLVALYLQLGGSPAAPNQPTITTIDVPRCHPHGGHRDQPCRRDRGKVRWCRWRGAWLSAEQEGIRQTELRIADFGLRIESTEENRLCQVASPFRSRRPKT